MIRTLQRYILIELIKVFVLAAATLSLLFFLIQSVVFWHKFGLSIGQLALKMPFIFPTVLTYSLPMATLATCTFSYGRLAAGNEILAMQSAGIHMMPIVAPALAVGLLLCPLTVVLYFDFIPANTQRAFQDVSSNVDALIKRLKIDKEINVGNRKIRIRDALSDRFLGVDIREDFSGGDDDRPVTQLHAREGYPVPSDEPGTFVLDLYDVSAVTKDASKGDVEDSVVIRHLPLPFTVGGDVVKSYPDMMTEEQLWEGMLRTAAGDGAQTEEGRRFTRQLWTEIHGRWAMSFTCFAFAMLGAPLGIFSRRGNFLGAFAFGCLPVFLMYYPMLIFGKSMAESGGLPVTVAMWAPNVFLLGLGCVLMYVLFRR